MTNLVDTSPETVNAEFDAAEKEIGTPEDAQGSASTQAENAAKAKQEEAQKEAEIIMATGMISTSLRFAVSAFVGVTIEEKLYTQTAEDYAKLIIKYFPGGMFAFLDRYKEELAAATSTLVLIKVIGEAKSKQLEEEEAKVKESAKGKTTFDPKPEKSEPVGSNNGNA